ncbi:uncharacterized protein LOC128237211 isoform X2 [Mya arenaria]|uniref:uncharacterized protein LOC128237211 isoform X2 n=1 Tax=Mya arenaria TaxID=6604 RepID=UPI0022E4E417|nr:uncharacterized protein LOC128237211 isoform X2 [Mya arenaria]
MSGKVPGRPQVVRDSEHTNLVLFGDSAFTHQTRSFTNAGLFYHGYHENINQYINNQDQDLRKLSETQHMYKTSDSSPLNQFWKSKIPDITNDSSLNDTEEHKGFFNPRPPSVVNMPPSSHTVVEGAVARPNSVVTGRPPSGLGRPGSGVRRSEGTSRPSSRISRPSSAYSHHGNRTAESPWPLDSDPSDPDHEPMGDVLSRLEEYRENFVASVSTACTDCECETEEQRVASRLARVYDSVSEDSQSDEEGVSLAVLLKTFDQYETRGHSASRQKAMMTLVNSYIPHEPVSHEQFKQVMVYMTTSVCQVQEACLVIVKHCVRSPSNLAVALDNGIINFLHDCLQIQTHFHLRKMALPVLEAIFAYPDHRDCWYEEATVHFLPKLVAMVKGQGPLNVKYAACCVFRSIALYEDFIPYVTQEILPTVLHMRNASAKFKEVYVEILAGVLSHTGTVPPELIDNSAIPITASIIREGPCGPQCAALHLLGTLTTSDPGVAMVIGTNSLVPMLLCCMKDSHCRKVRSNAVEVMRNLCVTRKLGLCKDLMVQLTGSLAPGLEQESLTNLSKMASHGPVATATKPRFDEERHLWMGLEKFIDVAKNLIFKEAKVDVDELDIVTSVHLTPGVDICPVRLGAVTHAIQLLHWVCLWPLDKSRLGFTANRVDLTTFTDDDKQRSRLSKINRGLTQAIWDKVGSVVTTLLASYAAKVTKVAASSLMGQSFCSLDAMFESQEVALVTSLLDILLCSALCTCTEFPELLPKLEEKPSKRKTKSQSKLKSNSTSQMSSELKSSQNTVESRLKSQSDSGKGFVALEDKIWVRDNPHLTNIHGKSDPGAAKERSRAELRHKEACTERRLLRRCLYEADVFACVCPFLKCREENVQLVVLQILRCLIQPLEERVAPKLSFSGPGTSGKSRNRPQTAGAVENANKRLNIALYQMSPDLASLIKDALGPTVTPGEEKAKTTGCGKGEKQVVMPGSTSDLETIHERLQDYTDSTKDQSQVSTPPPPTDPAPSRRPRPMIDRCRPIAQQCREALTEGLGEKLVSGVFTKTPRVKKLFVLLLHDFVQYGEVGSHMTLSSLGCMPRLLDFLRTHESNELLEIIGLIIVRLLVMSDHRLRQLFNRHGGPQLLLSMAQYTQGLLKQEVSHTLHAISKVEKTVRQRPMSAPVSRKEKARAPDIWDHITSRWKQEDRVTGVLRQWIDDNKQHRKK